MTSEAVSSADLAQLTLRRLNRACSDLGLTMSGREVFTLDTFPILDDDGTEIAEVYDVELNASEFEDYAQLATALERLAERLGEVSAPQPIPGDQKLPGMDDS